MKIGIHYSLKGFSSQWIEYCKEKNINYKIIDCYSNNIVQDTEDCNIIMWHFRHDLYKDMLFAKQLLFSFEQSGKIVFPSFNTAWHFDDKVGQKFLLESLKIPLVPSFVFFDKLNAKNWANHTNYPKVFKLRGGAGSANVELIKTKKEAFSKIDRAFSKGFSQFSKWKNFKDNSIKFYSGKVGFHKFLGSFARLFISSEFAKMSSRENGYVYFQEFIPKNNYDIRIIVIGENAFGIKRMVRENDFRASGSGTILYEKENFSDKLINLSFEIAEKLKTQCGAFDFIFDDNNEPLLVEISFGFTSKVYSPCEGYWNRNLEFHKGPFNPFGWMIEEAIKVAIDKNNIGVVNPV
ncbi:hypothetical protein [uncultured Christiangramia sp.]|uniref:ATP-grasp domain-containing protein n=1 Tax=Christiangramia sp. 3-2217-3z TaxID=3417564 RepID=UPI00260E890B|nr:hypothetical protein [uncultured Christiangramia sp.]